jgi:hypothetical protein
MAYVHCRRLRELTMFSTVQACPLPEQALLSRYTRDGAYTDCFFTDVPGPFTHEQFVEAFYTTWVFRLERWILSWSVHKPSNREQAIRLARGELDHFAAWNVEDRCDGQILLSDFLQRTRSWLMSMPIEIDGAPATRLYFGSAVIPSIDAKTGRLKLSRGFRALLRFHKTYSVVLLGAARRKLRDE